MLQNNEGYTFGDIRTHIYKNKSRWLIITTVVSILSCGQIRT